MIPPTYVLITCLQLHDTTYLLIICLHDTTYLLTVHDMCTVTAWSYQLCLPKHRLTPPGGVQYTQEWTHLAIAQQWMIWDTTHYTIPPAQTLSTNGEKYRSSSISSSNSYGCSSHSSFCIDSSISSPAMASAAETAKKATIFFFI